MDVHGLKSQVVVWCPSCPLHGLKVQVGEWSPINSQHELKIKAAEWMESHWPGAWTERSGESGWSPVGSWYGLKVQVKVDGVPLAHGMG